MMPLSLPTAGVGAPSKLVPDTPTEWSSVGERVATTPVGSRERELSHIVAMDLRTPADRPAGMVPTSA